MVGTLEDIFVIVFSLFDHAILADIFVDPEGLPLTLTIKSNKGVIPEFLDIASQEMRVKGFATNKDIGKHELIASVADNN